MHGSPLKEDENIIRQMHLMKWSCAFVYIMTGIGAWIAGMAYMDRMIYGKPINYWLIGLLVLTFLFLIYQIVRGYELVIDTIIFYKGYCDKFRNLATETIHDLSDRTEYIAQLEAKIKKHEEKKGE